MGMDVIGTSPAAAEGSYFRNNIWWWRPLWDYCEKVAPEVVAGVAGQTNDGDGLDGTSAKKLARILDEEIESGRCQQYAADYDRARATLGRHRCEWCGGTGVRSDSVGLLHRMPEKPLEPALAVICGRDRGWCNGCGGEGLKDDWKVSYRFSVDNVRNFASFCAASGGFRIL